MRFSLIDRIVELEPVRITAVKSLTMTASIPTTFHTFR
jgi:hypothetical protein